jgi:hypothetical protein
VATLFVRSLRMDIWNQIPDQCSVKFFGINLAKRRKDQVIWFGRWNFVFYW